MKRKALILLLAALMLLLAACGSGPRPAAVSAPERPSVSQEPEEAIPEPEAEPTPEPTPAMPPLPDIDITSWEFKLANSYNSIANYALPQYGGFEGQGIDYRIYEILHAFVQAARDAGLRCYVSVAYRNFDYWLYNYWSKLDSQQVTADVLSTYFLGPGVNDHQTGLAVDFTDTVEWNCCYYDYEAPGFEGSDLQLWLLDNCADYGFIPRYPEGKEEWYGTPCPAASSHFRYVGVEAAHYIMDNNLCLEEFIRLYNPELCYVPGKS